jgi:hypothetical protein
MRDATMKRGNPEPLTPELQAELAALAAMPENEIDATEMPPIADWSQAVRGPNVAELRVRSIIHAKGRPA